MSSIKVFVFPLPGGLAKIQYSTLVAAYMAGQTPFNQIDSALSPHTSEPCPSNARTALSAMTNTPREYILNLLDSVAPRP